MRDDRGSVLVLMPVAALVFIILGALCVDYGSVFVAKRELSNAATAAANDAASQAIDLDLFYATGALRLRPDVARAVAERSLAAEGLDRLRAEIAKVDVDDVGDTVTVTIRGRASYLFAKAVPGGRDGLYITASSSARATDIPAVPRSG